MKSLWFFITGLVIFGAGCERENASFLGADPRGSVDVISPQPTQGIDGRPVETEGPPWPELRVADTPPPPISGGTLEAGHGLLIVADPDRDRIQIVDPNSGQVRTVALEPGAEPGRIAVGLQHAFVVLRGRGEVVSINLEAAVETRRWPVCAAPRGIALGPDRLHVACASGTLFSFDVTGQLPDRRVFVEADLRDVVFAGGALYVSVFRAARIYKLTPEGAIDYRMRIPRPADGGVEQVAWRLRRAPNRKLVVLHQWAWSERERFTEAHRGGEPTYAVTTFDLETDETTQSLLPGALIVDVARSEQGTALAAAGSPVGESTYWQYNSASPDGRFEGLTDAPGQVTAVVWAPDGFWHYYREPARLVDPDGRSIALEGRSVADFGHALFHRSMGAGACANCHPEGRDDGVVWTFEDRGARRTQSLLGGVASLPPLNWGGEAKTLAGLVETELRRAQTEALTEEQMSIFAQWLGALQPITPSLAEPAELVEAGRVIFDKLECAACHGPAASTINYDVGTGGRFQAPKLSGVALRLPLMHDGCAYQLTDVLLDSDCSGSAHGRLDEIGPESRPSLIAYLRSL